MMITGLIIAGYVFYVVLWGALNIYLRNTARKVEREVFKDVALEFARFWARHRDREMARPKLNAAMWLVKELS